jgi:PAS domain S-box-containing protein
MSSGPAKTPDDEPGTGPSIPLQQGSASLLAQQRILELIATGAPLASTLTELVGFIESQEAGAICAILRVGDDGDHFSASCGPSLPARYHERLEGMPIAPPYHSPSAMTARENIHLAVADIADDERWAPDWHELAISCGLAACHTSPVLASDRTVLGSLVLFYASPRAPGAERPPVLGIATCLASIALERERAGAALHKSEREANQLLMALPVALYTTDAEGRITFCNPAAVSLWGCDPRPVQPAGWGPRLYWPDGRPMPREECHAAVALGEDRALCGEAWVERPDGSRVPFIAYSMPLHGEAGRLAGSVNMLVDITERKRSEEQRMLLVNELNHRVKNTLATVHSIAMQSLREEVLARDALASFEARLVALSRTHDILTRNDWRDASLRQVLEQELVPYCGRPLQRCRIEGGDFRLAPKMALALGLAFHELAANAARHGALSKPEGRLCVRWDVCGDMPAVVLRLVWSEAGGPPVEVPRHRGFGSRLIERGLAYELDGDVRMHYRPDGLVCTIEIPLMHRVRDGLAAPGVAASTQ